MNKTETFYDMKEIEITNSEKEGKKKTKTLQASALWQSEGGSNLQPIEKLRWQDALND